MDKIQSYWDMEMSKVDVNGTKFVVDQSGRAVRRTQRKPGRGAALEEFVRRSLPSELVKFEDLQFEGKPKSPDPRAKRKREEVP